MTLWPPESPLSCLRIKVLLISQSLTVWVTAPVITGCTDTSIVAFSRDMQMQNVSMRFLTKNSTLCASFLVLKVSQTKRVTKRLKLDFIAFLYCSALMLLSWWTSSKNLNCLQVANYSKIAIIFSQREPQLQSLFFNCPLGCVHKVTLTQVVDNSVIFE